MPYSSKENNSECKRKLLKGRKDAWFSKNGPCQHCGTWDNLQVDHIDPSQKAFSINWGIRIDVLEIELAKCQALCKPCHIKRSAEQKRKRIEELKGRHPVSAAIRDGGVPGIFKHGTRNGYVYHRCRCEGCRKAMNDYATERRKRPEVRVRINRARLIKNPGPSNGYLLDVPIPALKSVVHHGTDDGYYRDKCRCELCEGFAIQKRKKEQEIRDAKKLLRPIKPAFQITHGTKTAYQHHACRCEICKEFMRGFVKERWLKEKASRPPSPPKEKPPIVHGKYSTYCRHACRCEACCRVALDYRESKRALARSSQGT